MLQGELCLRLRAQADHRDLLQKRAVVAGRLQLHQSKLRGNVLGSDVTAAGAGAAALQQIVKEKTYVLADAVAANGIHRSRNWREQARMRGGSLCRSRGLCGHAWRTRSREFCRLGQNAG